MYTRQADKLIPLLDVPAPSSVGCPQIFSEGERVIISYESFQKGEPRTSVVSFNGVVAYFFGVPNDETLSAHPLSEIGLEPYAAVEVGMSSWIQSLRSTRTLVRSIGSQQPQYHHFLFAFHDGIFECIAEKISILSNFNEPLALTQTI